MVRCNFFFYFIICVCFFSWHVIIYMYIYFQRILSNFLSPHWRDFLPAMARHYDFDFEFVTYKVCFVLFFFKEKVCFYYYIVLCGYVRSGVTGKNAVVKRDDRCLIARGKNMSTIDFPISLLWSHLIILHVMWRFLYSSGGFSVCTFNSLFN